MKRPKVTVAPLADAGGEIVHGKWIRRRDGATHGQWTGEYRPPRKGELYLSGAEVKAWEALADLDTPYFIARPVRRVRVEEVFEAV